VAHDLSDVSAEIRGWGKGRNAGHYGGAGVAGGVAGKGTGRLFAAKVLLAVALLLGGPRLALELPAAEAQDTRPTLYVYLHTDAKSANLESALKEKLKALNVTVFGRYRDFEEALTTNRPDALLGLRALIQSQNAEVFLQGLRGQQDWEPYSLISAGATPLKGVYTGKVIGVVDLLGRRGTQEFVAGLLKTPEIKLKRVTKLEDLLPLLQLSAADAVLIPSSEVKAITEHSKLVHQVEEVPDGRVGLPAVSVLNPKWKELVVKQILKLDGETNRTLGVDKWRVP
jgi:hypothetical protein